MLAEWKEYNLYNPIICKIVNLSVHGSKDPQGFAFVLPLYESDWTSFRDRGYITNIGDIKTNQLKLVSINDLTLIDQEKIPKDILRDSKISDILS
jgi:hypothetical protein